MVLTSTLRLGCNPIVTDDPDAGGFGSTLGADAMNHHRLPPRVRPFTLIRRTTYARSGLVGNPSDLFGGKVISLLLDAFAARVSLYESARLTVLPNTRDATSFDDVAALVRYRRQHGYYGGLRLIEAILVRFDHCCRQRGIALPRRNCTIEYHSDIPFGVGLGGSSAIITAVFNALMQFYELTEADIPRPEQPNIILEAETVELGISAGPQDRVVAVYGGVVAMDFSAAAYARNGGRHGDYRQLSPDLLPPLFVAYHEGLAKSSGSIHNVMRYRAVVEHDPAIAEAMAAKAVLVDEALIALHQGQRDRLGPIMDRDFDLRQSVYGLPPEQTRMIAIAREQGAHAKFTGSGGAAIGTYEDAAHLERIERAYTAEGFTVVPVRVAPADMPVQAAPRTGAGLDGAAEAERGAPAAREARVHSAARP